MLEGDRSQCLGSSDPPCILEHSFEVVLRGTNAPGFSVRQWMRAPPYKDPTVMTREFGTLRKAGLPE